MDATPDALAPEPAQDASTAVEPARRSAAHNEVLAAAALSFKERGFAAASIDDVARRMGATKGRVYHYYRAKLDLFVDVVRHGLEVIHADVQDAEDAAGPAPAARMAAMVRAHLRSILLDQPFHRAALQGVELHLTVAATPDQREALAGVIALRDRHQRAFERVLAEGVAAGDFAPCDVKLRTRTLLAALNGPVAWYRPRPGETDGDRDRLIDDIAGFALAGLAPDKPATTNPKGRKA
ncbi:MAG: TetR/AcrR family transcriptional regulator [Pseudomonadota bacterium]